jgi:thiol-disulfide isomerase/thioredoxin
MRKIYSLLFLFFTISSFSQPIIIGPVVQPNEIVKDLMSWLYYERDHMIWSAGYATLDTELKDIPKEKFLESLATGKYLPLKVKYTSGILGYQLYDLKTGIDQNIVATIKTIASKELEHFKMEGKPLPDFSFLDLDGKVYNKESTNGSIIVINCWYVSCTPCIAEMPSLNELVKQYKKEKNILFLALSLDGFSDVRNFLKTTTFNYSIVPEMQEYLSQLPVYGYPTQIIVNRQGNVVKIIESNKIGELKDVLNKEIQK